MAIAKELTEALGGKISLQSVVARGSLFTIVLPVHQTSTHSFIDQAMPENIQVPNPVIHEQNVKSETDFTRDIGMNPTEWRKRNAIG